MNARKPNPPTPTVTRPRRGRPPAPPEEIRSHRLVTFVTDGEWAELHRLSQDEDKSLSALTYEILSRALRRRGRPRARSKDDQ